MDSLPSPDIYDPWRDEHGQIDPQRVAAHLERLGRAWAQLDAAAKALEKTTGTVLAQITVSLIDGGTKATEAKLRATASPEYEDHINAALVARSEANMAKVRWEAGKAGFEAMRTAEATHRAEMASTGRT